MDDQGRNFAQNEAMMAKFSWLAQPEGRVQGCTKQIIKTMIGKVKSSTPIYDANDPAELLKKNYRKTQMKKTRLKNPSTLILRTRLNPRFLPQFYFCAFYDAKVVFYIYRYQLNNFHDINLGIYTTSIYRFYNFSSKKKFPFFWIYFSQFINDQIVPIVKIKFIEVSRR